MGGGFGMKEMTLMIGSTGAGKTVFACQLATAFALNGEPGILITTEQTHDQLEPRYVACNCSIPIEQIKDGINFDKMSKAQVQLIKEMQAKIGKKMVILDWINDRSKTVCEDLSEEIRRFRSDYKVNPRWLIFDWIGGAMGAVSNKDMSVFRLIMQKTADKLADIAHQESMAVIALAQGNIKECRNNMRVDSTCLAENKSLGRNATTILGISQLQEQVDAMSSGEPPYVRKQFIFVSKARKGVGGLIPVRRAFEYQRYENLESSEKA
jgi:replicative DNA helicase